MFVRLHSPLRHPLYPRLRPTRARNAGGNHMVLAGSFEELEAAASRGASASHAVFLIQSEHAPPAGPRQRDLLWKWFRVPSYLLVLDARGRLAAYECEAQEGLHVPHPAAVDVAQTDLCPCGRPGPRITLPARSVPEQPLAHSLA
jgi:hypothetical protein